MCHLNLQTMICETQVGFAKHDELIYGSLVNGSAFWVSEACRLIYDLVYCANVGSSINLIK